MVPFSCTSEGSAQFVTDPAAWVGGSGGAIRGRDGKGPCVVAHGPEHSCVLPLLVGGLRREGADHAVAGLEDQAAQRPRVLVERAQERVGRIQRSLAGLRG